MHYPIEFPSTIYNIEEIFCCNKFLCNAQNEVTYNNNSNNNNNNSTISIFAKCYFAY